MQISTKTYSYFAEVYLFFWTDAALSRNANPCSRELRERTMYYFDNIQFFQQILSILLLTRYYPLHKSSAPFIITVIPFVSVARIFVAVFTQLIFYSALFYLIEILFGKIRIFCCF